MSKPLVVVESPTKVRTIKKYLGKKYNVAATVGHIKDLPPKKLGVDVESGFIPEYSTISGKQKIIKSLRQAARDADSVYLAPDPDREGEAIAFHAAEVLKKKGRKFYRVLFHELTRKAIEEAMASPGKLDIYRYDAQKARRILDRLVGYMISPLLWRKVKGGLSAGRVQSVAVRIICERERAIQAFNPEEYWSVTAELEGENPPPFRAKLIKKGDRKIKIPNETSSNKILDDLEGQQFIVENILKKTTKRNPLPPFITSKLQQEAIRKLRFSAKKTMLVAQQLYEGIDIGPGEPEGLITYMRTDSTRISEEAANDAITYINTTLGKKYAVDSPRFFKNRKKVQDAHEAIRPTNVFNTPEKIKPFLSKDQLALYSLVWKRFVASQMMQALINQNTISVRAGQYIFTVSGSSIKFPGFMALYLSADEEIEAQRDAGTSRLPELKKKEILNLKKMEPKQHFTMPPPRFSEASLVKELEENGIGRPSTYAAILSTIRDKGYVKLINRYFKPSELGFIVNDLLISNFPDLFNVEFTAKLESRLDGIETADEKYQQLLSRFYKNFSKEVDTASEKMLSMRGVGFATGINCPECGKHLNIKVGKNGHYIGCSGYPECGFTTNYTRDEKGNIKLAEKSSDDVSDKVCDKCGKPMLIKNGQYGKFMACSGYPDCKNTQSLVLNGYLKDTGVNCPKEKCSGKIVEKKSRRGKIFYSCDNYPDCDFAIWEKPVNKKCPECGADFLVEKKTKKEGKFLLCINQKCGYKEKINTE